MAIKYDKKKTCETCHYWVLPYVGSREGYCKCMPPARVVYSTHVAAESPMTSPAEYCGQHKTSK